MSNAVTTNNPEFNFYSSESQLTSQANPSTTTLHMIPAGGVSLPSARYIDITLPTSGGTYTAPADGWIMVSKTSSASGQYNSMYVQANSQTITALVCTTNVSGLQANVTLPVAKGQVVTFVYTVAGTTNLCRFVYANGSN